MKAGIDFVSKLLKRGMDEDFNKLHICYAQEHIQTYDGTVTLSHPSEMAVRNGEEHSQITVSGLSGANAINICDGIDVKFNVTDKRYIITAKEINFRVMLAYHSDYSPRTISKKKIKKASPLPPEFIKFVRSMTAFTIKDSDHQFASSINVINKRMYSTNNIAVVRSTKDLKFKMPDCIIPRPLINAILKIKDDPVGIIINDHFIAFTYSSGAFAMCGINTESAPALDAVFNDFKKPIQLDTNDKASLERSILMCSDGEVKCKDSILTTDNSEVKNTKLENFKVDVDNLQMLLKLFNNVRFTREYTYMQNDMFQAILAGRA